MAKIVSKPYTQEGRDNFERIFGKKDSKCPNEGRPCFCTGACKEKDEEFPDFTLPLEKKDCC